MADLGDSPGDVAMQAAKTLEDGQSEGEMKLCSGINTEEPYNKMFEIGAVEKQNKGNDEDTVNERNRGLLEELADIEGRSPCSESADVSLNSESPGLSKLNSSSEPLDEENKDSNYWRKRRRHNRHKGGKHRIRKAWKPYCKLTFEEQQKLDDKQTMRATRKRSEQFANGLPMAPYNTTQFLMADRNNPSPKAPQSVHDDQQATLDSPDHSPTWDDSFSDSVSLDDMTEKMVQEFQEDYQNYHAERLQDLSKEELVKEFIELEAKNEELEGKLDQNVRAKLKEHLDDVDLNGDPATLKKKFMEIVDRMSEENAKLARENQFLKVAAGKLQV